MAGQQAYMAKSNVQFTKDNEYYTPKISFYLQVKTNGL